VLYIYADESEPSGPVLEIRADYTKSPNFIPTAYLEALPKKPNVE
jgi:hypothetical protein